MPELEQYLTEPAKRAARSIILKIYYQGQEPTHIDDMNWLESQISVIADIIDRETDLPNLIRGL